MPRVYEICGDEAWVNTDPPLNRYWCFFAGLLCSKHDAEFLEQELQDCLDRHKHIEEIKWNNLYHENLTVYNELIDILLNNIVNREVRFRQIFLDRAYVHVAAPGKARKSNLDIQFHICYQFLKHAFGLQYLPRAVDNFDKILIRLDTHSSQKHKSELKKYVERIPSYLNRNDLDIHLAHVNSKHHVRLGVCDVMAGAAGSYGNRIHKKRKTGQRGMTLRQEYRKAFAHGIYARLMRLNKTLRDKNAFNWFESTSFDGDKENCFKHKIRFWKFVPQSHIVDHNWQNKLREPDGSRHIEQPF